MNGSKFSPLISTARSIGFKWMSEYIKNSTVLVNSTAADSASSKKKRTHATYGSNVKVCCLTVQQNNLERLVTCLNRTKLSALLGVPYKDLRLIDPDFKDHNPVVMVRRNSILLRSGQLSGAIKNDKIYLFEPDRSDVIDVANKIWTIFHDKVHVERKYVQDNPTGGELPHRKKMRRDDSIQSDVAGSKNGTFSHSFELMCLDACFQGALKAYDRNLVGLEDRVNARFNEEGGIFTDTNPFDPGFMTKHLHTMLTLKTELHHLENLISSLRLSVSNVLKEDEDMAAMYLTDIALGIKRPVDDHSDVEIMFEDYLQRLEELCSDGRALEQQISNHEELTRLHLDFRRNEYMQINLRVSLITMTCAIAGLISSMFGMNLVSSLEANPFAFWMVATTLVVLALTGFVSHPFFVFFGRAKIRKTLKFRNHA